MELRVGSGFDAHGRDEARPLVIGGVEIVGAAGLAGHSDADVLSHAIADALLGAAGLGDLGARFPGDERWREASSLDILRAVAGLLAEAGWRVVNVDATVVAEAPRLAPYRDEMAARVAAALGLEAAAVSVKATTTDRLGFTGRGEGIAAFAVALLER
jgi:2-C-methyl-D-erythritol 2,4-cyclodiphosphate synthase